MQKTLDTAPGLSTRTSDWEPSSRPSSVTPMADCGSTAFYARSSRFDETPLPSSRSQAAQASSVPEGLGQHAKFRIVSLLSKVIQRNGRGQEFTEQIPPQMPFSCASLAHFARIATSGRPKCGSPT